MTRTQWRQLAADVQTLAQCGRFVSAVLLLCKETGCGLETAWTAVKRLRALPVITVLALLWCTVASAQPFQPGLRVDAIEKDRGQTFVLSGAVIDFDFVHVWGFPDSGPVFLGGVLADKLDRALQRPTGGFELLVKDAPVGTYPIVVYAHDPRTNTFPLQWGQTFTVHPCATMTTVVRWVMRTPSLGVSAYGYQMHPVCAVDWTR
jgi:hypothetical protein